MDFLSNLSIRLLKLGRRIHLRGEKRVAPWITGLCRPYSELWYVFQGEGRLRVDKEEWQTIRSGQMIWFHRNRLFEWYQNPEKPVGVNFFQFEIKENLGDFHDETAIPLVVEVEDPAFIDNLSRRLVELYWEVYHDKIVKSGMAFNLERWPQPLFRKEPEQVRQDPFLPEPIGILAPYGNVTNPVVLLGEAQFRILLAEYKHIAAKKLTLEEVGLQRFHRRIIGNLVVRIQEDLENVPSITEMAAKCGYTLDHFGRVFRKVMGCGAQEFVLKAKVARGRQLLLETGLSVKEIAGMLGYNSPFFFSRQFKAVVGSSPTEFRARHGADAKISIDS